METNNNSAGAKIDLLAINFTGLFANLILIISTYWFSYISYTNLYAEIIGVSLILILGLFVKKIVRWFSVAIAALFFILFLFLNFNYMFVIGISLILGLMIANFARPKMVVPTFVYSLIPLFILLHVLWFNLLPFGFADEYRINVGSRNDALNNSDIYIIDSQRVLSPSQTYGSQQWRTFEKDGTFSIGFNTPVNLKDKTVEVKIRYDEATGPIYVNGELFYDPRWGTAASFGTFKEDYLYGAEEFNVNVLYHDTPVSKFLALTGAKSVETYILDVYGVNVAPHNLTKVGTVDLWAEKENIKKTGDVTLLKNSKFYDSDNDVSIDDIDNLDSAEDINELLKTPIEIFLEERNQSMQEFIDYELNNGPYPMERSLDNLNFDSMEEYFRTQFPNGVLMKDFTGQYPELEKEMVEKHKEHISSVEYYEGWSSEPAKIDLQFRGKVKFYGMFDESIKFSVSKQDMNLYNGSDDVSIIIRDFEGTIINTLDIPDNDGIDTRTTEESEWMEYSFEIPIEKSGIYRIEFDHKYHSKDPDFILGDITFNSNKIMIDGSFMLWGPGKLYNNKDNNIISARYWWDGYEQFANFENKTRFEIGENVKGSWVELNVADNRFFSFDKGKLIVSPKYNLAALPDTYIETEPVEALQITKSSDLKYENIKLVNIDKLEITGTAGTKITQIRVKVD